MTSSNCCFLTCIQISHEVGQVVWYTHLLKNFPWFVVNHIRVVSFAYLKLFIFLLAILIPACASYSPAFLMMYFAFKLNKQGDNIQSWRTTFPIWNQSVGPCPVLTVASQPAYLFLRRPFRWSGVPISLRIFHSLLWSTQSKALIVVNKAEIDVFLEPPCFFDGPMDIVNLISGSSVFSKSSLNIWKFTLKPGMENFEHYFTSVWDECNCCDSLSILWHYLSLGLEWKLNFSSSMATAEFSICAGIFSASP